MKLKNFCHYWKWSASPSIAPFKLKYTWYKNHAIHRKHYPHQFSPSLILDCLHCLLMFPKHYPEWGFDSWVRVWYIQITTHNFLKCSTLLASRVMQIKTTLKFYTTPIRILLTKKYQVTTKSGNVVGRVETLWKSHENPMETLWQYKPTRPL